VYALVRIEPDELFSSWLARAALRGGCNPLTLTSLLWQDWRPWTVDIDRGIPAERMQQLVRATGIDAGRLELAMLDRMIAGLSAGGRVPKTTALWLLARGGRNRRTRGGLAFCPACLADDRVAYFRRHWRLAWHTACERHGSMLADRCLRCLAPVAPHRCDVDGGGIGRCHSCDFDLRGTPVEMADSDAIAFQVQADRVLSDGVGMWPDRASIDSPAWFAAARTLAGRSLRQLDAHLGASAPPAMGLPLELQSVQERHLRLAVVGKRLNAGLLTPLFGRPPKAVEVGTDAEHTEAKLAWRRFLRRRGMAPF
jgi:hypothetical protein